MRGARFSHFCINGEENEQKKLPEDEENSTKQPKDNKIIQSLEESNQPLFLNKNVHFHHSMNKSHKKPMLALSRSTETS